MLQGRGFTRAKYDKVKFNLKLNEGNVSQSAKESGVSWNAVNAIKKSSCYLNYLALQSSPANLKQYLSDPKVALEFDRPRRTGLEKKSQSKTQNNEQKKGLFQTLKSVFVKG